MYIKTIVLFLILPLLLNCATFSPKEIEGKYGAYTKTNFLPSGKTLSTKNQLAVAMKHIDERIEEEDYFGHLSEIEYQEAITEIVTGMAYTESSYSLFGFYYFKNYANEKELYDLHFNSQQVTYSGGYIGPSQYRTNEMSVISVQTNPKTVLSSAFGAQIIYLILLQGEFYILKSAEDVNAFVGNNFDTSKLVEGNYERINY